MAEVRGRNLVTGLPESIEISSIEVREALSQSVSVIIDTIKDALDEVPPEIVADLMDNVFALQAVEHCYMGWPTASLMS